MERGFHSSRHLSFNVRASKSGERPLGNLPVAIGTAQVVVPEGATPQTQIPVGEVVLRQNTK